jgi:hypothetical protein
LVQVYGLGVQSCDFRGVWYCQKRSGRKIFCLLLTQFQRQGVVSQRGPCRARTPPGTGEQCSLSSRTGSSEGVPWHAWHKDVKEACACQLEYNFVSKEIVRGMTADAQRASVNGCEDALKVTGMYRLQGSIAALLCPTQCQKLAGPLDVSCLMVCHVFWTLSSFGPVAVPDPCSMLTQGPLHSEKH